MLVKSFVHDDCRDKIAVGFRPLQMMSGGLAVSSLPGKLLIMIPQLVIAVR